MSLKPLRQKLVHEAPGTHLKGKIEKVVMTSWYVGAEGSGTNLGSSLASEPLVSPGLLLKASPCESEQRYLLERDTDKQTFRI